MHVSLYIRLVLVIPTFYHSFQIFLYLLSVYRVYHCIRIATAFLHLVQVRSDQRDLIIFHLLRIGFKENKLESRLVLTAQLHVHIRLSYSFPFIHRVQVKR